MSGVSARSDALASERLLLPIPGGTLAVTKLQPTGAPARALILINCAMGVKQSSYRAFAQFLAGSGYAVMTWDYRGVGESVMEASAKRRVSLEDWANDDFARVLASAASGMPGVSILVVGHSFGGQILALPENRYLVRGALLIACPSGYVGHWRGKARGRFMWALAHLGLPVLTRLFGQFPAARLGLGTNLPRQVALQWGQWLRHPRYIGASAVRSARLASFSAPLSAVSFTDDEYAPPEAVDAMLALYQMAAVTRESISPAEHGLDRIGHMGFFRPRASSSLWAVGLKHLEALLQVATPAYVHCPDDQMLADVSSRR